MEARFAPVVTSVESDAVVREAWRSRSRWRRAWDVLRQRVPEAEWRTWPLSRQRAYLCLDEDDPRWKETILAGKQTRA